MIWYESLLRGISITAFLLVFLTLILLLQTCRISNLNYLTVWGLTKKSLFSAIFPLSIHSHVTLSLVIFSHGVHLPLLQRITSSSLLNLHVDQMCPQGHKQFIFGKQSYSKNVTNLRFNGFLPLHARKRMT